MGLCACDGASCAGCCDANGACQEGTFDDGCGRGGAACRACAEDQACSGGACRGIPRFVPCQAAQPAGRCGPICAARGLTCSARCTNPFEFEDDLPTVAGTTFVNATCSYQDGVMLFGLASCDDAFPASAQSAWCCCE
jgi:hypothetical protein